MKALIDGDMVCFRAASSCEPTKAKPYLEPLDAAIFRADDLTRRILRETDSDSYSFFLGGEGNFRYEIYDQYKANRAGMPKPTYYQEVRAHVVTEFNATLVNGIETDDAMGIEQCAEPFMTTVIASNDKDMLMIPGQHYNPITQTHKFVTPLDGLKHFYQQLIQGDQADNIPGYDGKMRPKIPKFLQPVIDEIWSCPEELSMYSVVSDMYSDLDIMHRNARLLWIQRKENDIWLPPHDRQDEENN